MSALMEAVSSVLGSDVDKAKARAESVSSQLDAAKAKLGKAEATLAESNVRLARAVETGEGDPEKIAAAGIKAEEDIRPLRRAVEALTGAKAAADEALLRVRQRAELAEAQRTFDRVESAMAKEAEALTVALRNAGTVYARCEALDVEADSVRKILGKSYREPRVDVPQILAALSAELAGKSRHPRGQDLGAWTVEVPYLRETK